MFTHLIAISPHKSVFFSALFSVKSTTARAIEEANFDSDNLINLKAIRVAVLQFLWKFENSNTGLDVWFSAREKVSSGTTGSQKWQCFALKILFRIIHGSRRFCAIPRAADFSGERANPTVSHRVFKKIVSVPKKNLAIRKNPRQQNPRFPTTIFYLLEWCAFQFEISGIVTHHPRLDLAFWLFAFSNFLPMCHEICQQDLQDYVFNEKSASTNKCFSLKANFWGKKAL